MTPRHFFETHEIGDRRTAVKLPDLSINIWQRFYGYCSEVRSMPKSDCNYHSQALIIFLKKDKFDFLYSSFRRV